MERHANGVERLDVLRQAVPHAALFRFEGAKQAVPDDEDAAVVAIEVLLVDTVVNSMMRGSSATCDIGYLPRIPW